MCENTATTSLPGSDRFGAGPACFDDYGRPVAIGKRSRYFRSARPFHAGCLVVGVNYRPFRLHRRVSVRAVGTVARECRRHASACQSRGNVDAVGRGKHRWSVDSGLVFWASGDFAACREVDQSAHQDLVREAVAALNAEAGRGTNR